PILCRRHSACLRPAIDRLRPVCYRGRHLAHPRPPHRKSAGRRPKNTGVEVMETRIGRRVLALACGLLVLSIVIGSVSKGQDAIDRQRVKELYEKSKRGDKLSPEEQKYLDRALQIPKKSKDKKPFPVKVDEKREEQPSTGLKPLTEMTA